MATMLPVRFSASASAAVCAITFMVKPFFFENQGLNALSISHRDTTRSIWMQENRVILSGSIGVWMEQSCHRSPGG